MDSPCVQCHVIVKDRMAPDYGRVNLGDSIPVQGFLPPSPPPPPPPQPTLLPSPSAGACDHIAFPSQTSDLRHLQSLCSSILSSVTLREKHL